MRVWEALDRVKGALEVNGVMVQMVVGRGRVVDELLAMAYGLYTIASICVCLVKQFLRLLIDRHVI